MPHSWQERLFPVFDEEAEQGSEDASSDLLSASQRRVFQEEGKRDVVLGIETFTSTQGKVRLATAPAALSASQAHADECVAAQYISVLTWVRS